MPKRSYKIYAVPVVLVPLAVAAAWNFVADTDEASDLPEELSVAALKKQSQDDPSKLWQNMRREDLSEEQRQALRRNVRQVMSDMMTDRLDEYFAADEHARQEVLDRHIDEMQARMEEWRERREQRHRELEAEGKDPEAEEQARRDRWRNRNQDQTQSQRKERSESRDPNQMARRMAYMSAMRDRMQERGIESPWGQWGRRRPPGS